jgi:hypothetical protein
MTTVRNAILDLCRAHRLTTWFGNPGSSELALLEDFPDDFRYFLGRVLVGRTHRIRCGEGYFRQPPASTGRVTPVT